MIAAKTGFIADFKIGHDQRQIILHQAEVIGGTDTVEGLTGFAVARLVKVTALGDAAIVQAATGVTANDIGDATHIIAQSDDTLRNVIGDAIPVERYNTRARGILGNTATAVPAAVTDTMKSIAVWRITDATDIKIIPIKPVNTSVIR